jgi:hypothetical protein
MNEMRKFGTTIPMETHDQMKEIAKEKRWNLNDVLIVAVKALHREIIEIPSIQAPVSSISSETKLAERN